MVSGSTSSGTGQEDKLSHLNNHPDVAKVLIETNKLMHRMNNRSMGDNDSKKEYNCDIYTINKTILII